MRTGHANVALVNEKYHALDAEILACQGQASEGGKYKSQGIYSRLEALRLNIINVYQKWHASIQNNSGLTPLEIETHSQQNQILSNTNTNMPNIHDARIELRTTFCKEPKATLTRVIQTAPNLYTLKKRLGYLAAFVEFVIAKARKQEFHKPRLNATYLEKALHSTVLYVQRECFCTVSDSLQEGSPDWKMQSKN